ncbi:hypothetical protein Mnod_0935 [Methylobacterium nodulans ORS 2060]|uniref:Uncharacterized protein n=1 Tax=Methylobacterium nodulans (strain LMG 21967 / CNCM I-2342 / ORS 2060) TaxID=460265 RepID=B8IHR4_METNO|nr:hypothetical protein Mnod_0935 [Methylobacterium nodulans ORS 2060]
MSDVNNTIDVAEDAPAKPETSLSLTDIANAVQVIDFAADAGAFRGWRSLSLMPHDRRQPRKDLTSKGAIKQQPICAAEPRSLWRCRIA